MFPLLLIFALAAQPQGALGGSLSALAAQTDMLNRNRDEAYLVNKRIGPALLRNLMVWTPSSSAWQAPANEEDPGAGARVRVLHLWGTFCAPCEREFPSLRSMASKATHKYRGKVRYLFIAESTDSESMRGYLDKHRGKIPDAPHYHDTQGQIMEMLRSGLPSGKLSLPATLLIDEHGVVRQAIVGPLTEPGNRQPELLDAIERLLALP